MAEALRLAAQIASALDEAHRKGILHRDLKPANIMVTAPHAGSLDRPTVKVLDFGLATLVDTDTDVDVTRTAEGTIVGTPAYMAPEQSEGRQVDARADIFSFGAVLYELLSGTRAFPGLTRAQVLNAVLHDDPAPLQTTPGLSDLVRRCLEKRPERRFQTMTDVRAALDRLGAASTAIDRQPSVAVLPFVNMSADPDNEYFSDGLAEEIINELAHVPGLKVIARTSAFAFKGKHEDVRRIAEALDVTNILEGSVRRAGHRIRVNAQLVAATDGSHLWSERYDRELADVFAIQDEIARAIVRALQMTLPGRPAAQGRYVPSMPAYEAYLKALHHANKLTPDGLARQREHLEQAISLDPGFALAHSRLGFFFFSLYVFGLQPARDVAPPARAHVLTALEIDPSLPEGHMVMCCLAAMCDYDWTEADRRFRLACARDRVPPREVRAFLANFFLAHVGRAQEAVADLEQALTEDPLNIVTQWSLAVSLRSAHRDEEADARFEEIVALDQGLISSYAAIVLSGNHVERGELQQAIQFAETAYRRDPWHPVAVGQLAGVLARAGHVERSEALIAQLRPGEAFGAPFGLAACYLAAGDLDQAADWLEKAIDQRDIWVPFLLRVGNIGGRVMWSSPRWPRLAKLLNVPETN